MALTIKKLFINGEPSHIEFNIESTDEHIAEWVRNNLDRFDLNEPHNCTVTQFDHMLNISGDEDLMEINILRKKLLIV